MMDDYLKRIYFWEVSAQCNYARLAIRALDFAIKELDLLNQESFRDKIANGEKRRIPHSEVFRSLYSFMTHTANVSKLFWTPEKEELSQERSKMLREAMNIDDAHILKNRALRNALDHFDHRLDKWNEENIKKGRSGFDFSQDSIGSWGSAGIKETDIMRWYDPQAHHFIFRGERYDIQKLYMEINIIFEKVELLINKITFPQHQIS